MEHIYFISKFPHLKEQKNHNYVTCHKKILSCKKYEQYIALKKNFLFFCLVNVLILENQQDIAANPYEDIFTRDIYNISSAKRKNFFDALNYKENQRATTNEKRKNENNKRLAQLARKALNDKENLDPNDQTICTLYYQKLQCVYNRLTRYLLESKDFLEESRKKIQQTHGLKGGTGIIKDVVSSVTSWFANPVGAGMKAVAYVGSNILSSLTSTLGNQDLDEKTCLNEFDKAIISTEKEIRKLEEGVFTEPIKELEEKYVKIQMAGNMHKDLQKTIENYFINSRKASYPFPFVKQCLEYSLELPQEHKNFGDSEPLIRKFRQTEFFQTYSSSTRKQLESVLLNLIQCSNAPDDSRIPLRRAYYIHGEPGIGKSSSVQQLVKFLGLPCYKAKIKSIGDLTADNLEGSDALSPRVNLGWLVKPLLVPDEGGKTYKNSVLILDDFDRVLLDPNSGATGLSFFLDYLDPLKKTFESPYFGAEIDISRMHIFVTANLPLPNDENYAAVKERFSKIILFDPMEACARKGILMEYFPEVANFYAIPPFELEGTQKERLVDIAMSLAENPSSIRSLQNTLRDVVGEFKLGGWKRLEQNRKLTQNPTAGSTQEELKNSLKQKEILKEKNDLKTKDNYLKTKIKVGTGILGLYFIWAYLLPLIFG